MFAWGIADLGGGNDETVCAMIIAISAVLFFAFPDRIHRVLSVLFAVCALVVLIYDAELNAVVPVQGPALAGALVAVQVGADGSLPAASASSCAHSKTA